MDHPEWEPVSPGMYGAVCMSEAHGKQFMVVEALPFRGWDWLAWEAEDGRVCLHGFATSRAAAMRAAELAARQL